MPAKACDPFAKTQVEGPRGTLNSRANACSGRVWIPSNVELSGWARTQRN